MNPGDKVKVSPNHRFHPNREGIIIYFFEEESAGLATLRALDNYFCSSDTYFTVDIDDLMPIT
jgi:hypothetical protein